MSFYRLNGIKFDDLGKELQRFFVSNNIKTPIVSKGMITFEKGSLWAVTSKNFLVKGKLRIQYDNQDISCNFMLDRTKIWLVNAIITLVSAALIIVLSVVSFYQALDLRIYESFWISMVVIFVLAISIPLIFTDLYLVNAAEKKFIESFEMWFGDYL